MNEGVAKKIIKSIKDQDISEFEKIISGINANNLGEKVIQNFSQKSL
jgi:hypothetical protein